MRNWKLHKDGDVYYIRYSGGEEKMKEVEKKLKELGIRYTKCVNITFDIRRKEDIKRIVTEFPNIDLKKQKFMEKYFKSRYLEIF